MAAFGSILFLLLGICSVVAAEKAELLLIGTCSTGMIHAYVFEPASSTLSFADSIMTEGPSPSWIALHPQIPNVFYCADGSIGSTSAFRYSVKTSAQRKSGYSVSLSAMSTTNNTGVHPVSVLVKRTSSSLSSVNQNYVITAAYMGGTLSTVAINSDGSLASKVSDFSNHSGGHTICKIDNGRQASAHPHSIELGPYGKYAYSPDLGLDKVFQYSIGNNGKFDIVSETQMEPCTGPRRMTFNPNKQYAYVLHEMGNIITVHHVNQQTGELSSALQSSTTLPEAGWHYCDVPNFPIDGKGNCSKAAEVRITGNGDYLYASNRGHNSIVVFKIENNGAAIRLMGAAAQVVWARAFDLSPDSQYLYAMSDDSPNLARTVDEAPPGSLVVFKVDLQTGALNQVAMTNVSAGCAVSIIDL
eukprot:m.186691 g.186691  ORF g.186691 m.186691 type:complete len:415 (+) comp15594_c0_seq3:192-1436(+)